MTGKEIEDEPTQEPFGYIKSIPCYLVTETPRSVELIGDEDLKPVKAVLPGPLPHLFGSYDEGGKMTGIHMDYVGLSRLLHEGAPITFVPSLVPEWMQV